MTDAEFEEMQAHLKRPVLDVAASAAGRDEGMADAAAGASLRWFAEADACLRRVMQTHAEFTSDDLWAAGLSKPREPRALGPVFRHFVLSGLIRSTGRFIKTAQVLRHRAPIAVWAVVK